MKLNSPKKYVKKIPILSFQLLTHCKETRKLLWRFKRVILSNQCDLSINILYFFGYKTGHFSSLHNHKGLDPSYKMDLDLWDCFGRVKLELQQNFCGLIYLFVVILEKGKTQFYSQINTVHEPAISSLNLSEDIFQLCIINN